MSIRTVGTYSSPFASRRHGAAVGWRENDWITNSRRCARGL
jgi:hypothetical protein